MPFSILSAPAAVPISAETRLAYVRLHLAKAYPDAPVHLLGYAGYPVAVVARDFGFFERIKPYPPAPNWREWDNHRLPFFFDNPVAPLLTLSEGHAVLGADIVSAVFYLLSGWQEYFSNERDRHGRFPYVASVQARYGFVTLPVVNYYFDILRTALKHVSKQPLRPRRWGSQKAPFAAFISHDVDNLRSAWKAPAKVALQQRQFGLFGKLLWQHLTRPDAWDNLEAVATAVAVYGGRSTFFILPNHHLASNGTPNADYRLRPQLKQRLRQLWKQGCELGIHGSLGTAIDTSRLVDEAQDAGVNLNVRFHYLSWEPRETIKLLNQTELKGQPVSYDATLGFAEHYGFRHSYCQPFYPFDFTAGRAADFLEIPLNVMDATLHHPNYLQLAPDEILPTLAPVFAEIKRFGGVASVLWHNENFDPANVRNGPQQFHELMAHLQAQGAAFRTGREIWEEFTAEPAAETQNS
jgi:hypothetical protein